MAQRMKEISDLLFEMNLHKKKLHQLKTVNNFIARLICIHVESY